MLYNEDFIQSLKDDPVKGIVELCNLAQDNLIENSEGWHEEDYKVLTEAYALLSSLYEAGLVIFPTAEPGITGAISRDCEAIAEFLRRIKANYVAEASKLRMESLKTHFRTALASGFCYEFSQGDLEKVQTLLNELREQIVASTLFEKEHKHRLLMRMEKLQSELHKKVSDLDRFWGLIGDAGVALGKFGKDAKPLVDRVKEIAQIVWQTQARAEELPSGTDFPLLGVKKED